MKYTYLSIILILGFTIYIQSNNNKSKEEAEVVETLNSLPVSDLAYENEDGEKIYKVVDQMPIFPGCEHIEGNNQNKENCGNRKLMDYVYKNMGYPKEALEHRIQGMAVIQFVVEEDGSIADAKIVRNLEGGCGEAALSVVEGMVNLPEKWTPAKVGGKSVKALYTLPVRFKLQD